VGQLREARVDAEEVPERTLLRERLERRPHLRMGAGQRREDRAVEPERSDLSARANRGRAPRILEQRHLAEALAGVQDVQRHIVAALAALDDACSSTDEQVEGVRLLAFADDRRAE